VAEIRRFLSAEHLDRERFLRLVQLLHALSPAEREVAYRHMMSESTSPAMSTADDKRVRLLARLADFVNEEPPAPGTPYGAELFDRHT
jgi:hypothetical protein